MTRFPLAVLLLAASAVAADERILAFDSDIRVTRDGELEVTETITVRAEGREIRRGIYRDFSTTYRDGYGNAVEVVYVPLAVTRNGAAENFFSETYLNGVRTYFGSADRLLPVGEHTYEFRYRADRMLGFFERHDELYWNVTGHDWAFPIDAAGATVRLDFDAPVEILEAGAYTGRMGARGTAFTSEVTGQTVAFRTTAGLGPHEGLTVVVGWPKGAVPEPDRMERLKWFLSDNSNALVALAGFAAMLAYLVPVWRARGRDPEEGLIVTRYEPPEGFSPASLRYIRQMYYDTKVMTSAVINLAVKGYLTIDNRDGQHTLRKTDPGDSPPPLATGEAALYRALFGESGLLTLENGYHRRIREARSAHRKSLVADYHGRYFRTNGLLSLPALVIGGLTALIALNVGTGPSVPVIAVLVAMVVLFLVFKILMRRPTVLGRRVLDEMLGFKDYLEVAEKDELNLRNPPEKTPQLFEAYLPFALAMGVEQHWAERFASVFASLRGADNTSYQPAWYSGSWNSFDIVDTTSAMSAGLGSAISSSVTPPGSSSGGGGGGFSGGGGGGGGGGGW